MQVWSFPVFNGPPDVPGGCTRMASGRSLLNPGDRFWLAGRFDISYAGDIIVTCFRDDHECGFDVPPES
jgi:phosphopantetheinyl transferase